MITKKAGKRRINDFKIKICRRTVRIPVLRKDINALAIQEFIELNKLSYICRIRTLKFFDHIARYKGENLEKTTELEKFLVKKL